MRFEFRSIYVVFSFTAILIFSIYLRSVDNRIFYKLYTIRIEESRLKKELWQKQLELESLINPAAISERFSEEEMRVDE
jgi:hypothetical protein